MNNRFLVISLWPIVAILCLMQRAATVADKMDKINECLLRSTDDKDDFETNLKAAQELLEEKGKERHLFSKSATAEQLKVFTELTKVLNEDKCTLKAYEIIDENLRSIAGPYMDNTRRVNYIILNIARTHKEDCAPKIVADESARYANLDKTQVSRVGAFTDAALQCIAKSYELEKKEFDTKSYLSGEPEIRVWDDWDRSNAYPKLVLKALQDVTKGTADEAFAQPKAFSKDKLHELYEAYIVKPCEYYLSELSDALNLWRNNYKCYRVESSAYDQINEHHYRLQICRQLKDKDEKKLFEELVKVAAK